IQYLLQQPTSQPALVSLMVSSGFRSKGGRVLQPLWEAVLRSLAFSVPLIRLVPHLLTVSNAIGEDRVLVTEPACRHSQSVSSTTPLGRSRQTYSQLSEPVRTVS